MTLLGGLDNIKRAHEWRIIKEEKQSKQNGDVLQIMQNEGPIWRVSTQLWVIWGVDTQSGSHDNRKTRGCTPQSCNNDSRVAIKQQDQPI